ncbi:MAG: septum formation protein Maf [Anaerolineae bacterium]|nr:septum formation protein Maf [Anaerolineae bacterium]
MTALKILLASASPRRRSLLALTGWDFRVQAVDIDETPRPGETPEVYVLRLAQEKAHAARPFAAPGEHILASDTIVVDDGELLGKPADAAEARAMLRRLRGREHFVYTALAVLNHGDEAHLDLCAAPVPMRSYSDAEIEAYIATGDPFDKAGAYAIQHRGFHPVEQFHSCFACVMGLPLCHLGRSFRALGYTSTENIPANCQVDLSYVCPVHRGIFPEAN